MSELITIKKEDIFQQIKLSCQIPEIVEQIVTRKLITSAAEKAGINIETEELQKAADLLRLTNKLTNADDTWKWLEKHSLSLNDFEQIIYHSIVIGKLVQHLFSEKIEPYFFENQLEFACVVMSEVVLDDEDLALELFYAIKEGEMSFYDVAHKYIQNTELRRKGGYSGVLYRKVLKPEISAAVFAATPPQVLKPIVSSQGIHLIFVEEIIQPKLDDQLRREIASNFLYDWIKQQSQEFEFNLNMD